MPKNTLITINTIDRCSGCSYEDSPDEEWPCYLCTPDNFLYVIVEQQTQSMIRTDLSSEPE